MPAYVVASWTDQGLHTRGTLEGFKRIASREKWLEVHGRKKWAYFYEPASVRRQQQFFDHFLRGDPHSMDGWPRVNLEAREKFYVGGMRAESEWPVARTRYTKLFLNAEAGSLQAAPVARAGSRRYTTEVTAGESQRAVFDMTFAEPTELIGHMKLHVWAAAEEADDMDLFVAIQKLDVAGVIVPFAFWAHFDDGPVALGWLRASHRELDAARSTEHQPVLAHRRELKLKPGEVVPLDIEIWPSGTRFETGERLRLVIQGKDIYSYPKPVMCDRHEQTVNRGRHVIHARRPVRLLPARAGGSASLTQMINMAVDRDRTASVANARRAGCDAAHCGSSVTGTSVTVSTGMLLALAALRTAASLGPS